MISTNASGTSLSQNFISKLGESSRHFVGKIRYNNADVSCDIKRITITKGACGDDTLVIGSVFSSYAEIVVNNLGTQLENKDIEIQIGLGTEYIKMGKFTVTKVQSSTYESVIRAVGFITSKVVGDITMPATKSISNLISAIQSKSGLTVTLNGLSAAGTITAPMPQLSCRDTLQIVSFLLGGYATEGADGNIVISKYAIPQNKLAVNGDRMLEPPTFGDNTFVMSGVKVIVSEASVDDEGTAIPAVSYESGTVRQIYENKYMTESMFSTFASNVIGYTYMPGEVGLSLGDPRLEPWDCLSVTDNSNNTYTVPCLTVSHTFDGGLSSRITAAGASTSDTVVEGSVSKYLAQVNSELITAQAAADSAWDYADQAKGAAETANGILEDMEEAATAAGTTLTQIYQDAADAAGAADRAGADALSAAGSARDASSSASNALKQLSLIENVVDTLDWVYKHGTFTATTDTVVNPDKYYYVYSNGEYSIDPGIDPECNPSTQGYYELTGIDEAVSNYVATHLSLSGDGLFVQIDDNSAKLQLSPNGIVFWNENGDIVATYSEDVTLGDTDGVHITLGIVDGVGELGFYQGTNKVAWLNENTLFIKEAQLTNKLRIGMLEWQVTNDANDDPVRVTLKYSPI